MSSTSVVEPKQSAFLFVYGSPKTIEALCSAATSAILQRSRSSSCDSVISLVRTHAAEIVGGGASGSQVVDELAAWCRSQGHFVRSPVSDRLRVRNEHAAILPTPITGIWEDDLRNADAGLEATRGGLSSVLRGAAAGINEYSSMDPTVRTDQAVRAAANALRGRYTAEWGSPCPWEGCTEVVKYGLYRGLANARKREMAGRRCGAARPDFACVTMVEPRRTDVAVFDGMAPGAHSGMRLWMEKEQHGPSILACPGGQREADVDASLWATALREAEEEACLDFRPLLQGLQPTAGPDVSGTAPVGDSDTSTSHPHACASSASCDACTSVTLAVGLDEERRSPDGRHVDARFWLRVPDGVQFELAGTGTDCTVLLKPPLATVGKQ